MPPDPYMSQQKTMRRNERRRADYQRKRDAAHCMNQLTDFLIMLTQFSSNWCSWEFKWSRTIKKPTPNSNNPSNTGWDFGRSSYTQYDPLHCSTRWVKVYINDKKSYWFHLAPQTPQSGSCQRHIPDTPATCEQWLKQIACCITPPSMQRLTLPPEADYQEPQSDDESENEDVPYLGGDGWLDARG